LRFSKWLRFRKVSSSAQKILVMLTGDYPQRYAYNSIYPYTIDDEYDSWQIRFLSEIDRRCHSDIVVRDYHSSSDISRGIVRMWAYERGIEVSAELPLWDALQESKIAIQTVPQTTYLETMIANHPTLCFWNPEANMIRNDLMPYFEGLVTAGVLHRTPESAARKLNEVESDPVRWWSSPEVQSAVSVFRDNVCQTSPMALAEWAEYISGRKIQ
jgi:putative transferase (TIGR04331 family)